MFFLAEECSLCGNGGIGFYRCSDGKTIVFVCTECGTVWDDPQMADQAPVQFLNAENPPLPGHDCTLGGPVSGWATRQEIEAANLANWIAGEGSA
ncbi:hypothetical protein [Bremerella sp.]|uniref:hypothetical protein n=1 Tax=Bremerella sp. TaxID=2795602 RepID=UPI00391A4E1C